MFRSTSHVRLHMLIDIGANSVAGGYVAHPVAGSPILCYGKRTHIVKRPEETSEAAVERMLELIANALVREGASAALRATGTSSIDDILVSIDAPWQTTSVRTERFQGDAPFTLTKDMAKEVLAQRRGNVPTSPEPGRAEPADSAWKIEEHIVEIRLNGYQTRDPYGKQAHRVAFVILTSSLSVPIADAVAGVLRRHFHHAHAAYVSGPSLRYQVLRAAFPHERDFLIIDALEPGVAAVSLVRAGALTAVSASERGLPDASAWLESVKRIFRELAASYPLPHVALLVAGEAGAERAKQGLDSASLSLPWFANKPLNIVPVSSNQFASIRVASEAPQDIRLLLMSQYQNLSAH